MAKIDIREAKVYVDSELYNAGMTEDGEDFLAESYFIVVERLDGHRMSHLRTFAGCEAGVIEENGPADGLPYFADIRKEAKGEADSLVSRILDAGVIDDIHWTEIEPSYGSAYYCEVYNF